MGKLSSLIHELHPSVYIQMDDAYLGTSSYQDKSGNNVNTYVVGDNTVYNTYRLDGSPITDRDTEGFSFSVAPGGYTDNVNIDNQPSAYLNIDSNYDGFPFYFDENFITDYTYSFFIEHNNREQLYDNSIPGKGSQTTKKQYVYQTGVVDFSCVRANSGSVRSVSITYNDSISRSKSGGIFRSGSNHVAIRYKARTTVNNSYWTVSYDLFVNGKRIDELSVDPLSGNVAAKGSLSNLFFLGKPTTNSNNGNNLKWVTDIAVSHIAVFPRALSDYEICSITATGFKFETMLRAHYLK